MKPHRIGTVALLAASLALSANAAQEQKDKPQASFEGGEERVVAVEVPVNVVGRDGRPVRGLTAADFEVFDNGDRQPLAGFEVVDLAALGTADTKATAAAVPAGHASAADLEPLDSTERRHFLLLFDLSF